MSTKTAWMISIRIISMLLAASEMYSCIHTRRQHHEPAQVFMLPYEFLWRHMIVSVLLADDGSGFELLDIPPPCLQAHDGVFGRNAQFSEVPDLLVI